MSVETTVPILCRFWTEDEVWNGMAEDIAVCVTGATFEEALSNMRDAIESHFESAIELGEFGSLVGHLRSRATDYGFLSLDEITASSPLVKMLVAVKDQELVAVT